MLAKLAFVVQRLNKISEKFFAMINKDGGGAIFGFNWGAQLLWGGHRAHGGVPPLGKTLPGMAVFRRSAVVSPAFKKQFYKELQTHFL